MQTEHTTAGVRAQVRAWRAGDKRVALVPTMGNLHAGHLSLLDVASAHAARVIVSVFVNPLQFAAGEDFERYPRTPTEDERLLAAYGCDLLFAPDPAQMYPGGAPDTRVHVGRLSEPLCGQFRPGHFDGVATVVAKLFGIVAPDLAVFGEKDYQQLLIVRRMVADLDMPIEILGAPIVRAADGLALSSRNQYLSAAERVRAVLIHQTLADTVRAIGGGARDYEALQATGAERLQRAGFRVDYFAIRDALDLAPARPGSVELAVLAAAWLGGTRLIDNLRVRC